MYIHSKEEEEEEERESVLQMYTLKVAATVDIGLTLKCTMSVEHERSQAI